MPDCKLKWEILAKNVCLVILAIAFLLVIPLFGSSCSEYDVSGTWVQENDPNIYLKLNGIGSSWSSNLPWLLEAIELLGYRTERWEVRDDYVICDLGFPETVFSIETGEEGAIRWSQSQMYLRIDGEKLISRVFEEDGGVSDGEVWVKND